MHDASIFYKNRQRLRESSSRPGVSKISVNLEDAKQTFFMKKMFPLKEKSRLDRRRLRSRHLFPIFIGAACKVYSV